MTEFIISSVAGFIGGLFMAVIVILVKDDYYSLNDDIVKQTFQKYS